MLEAAVADCGIRGCAPASSTRGNVGCGEARPFASRLLTDEPKPSEGTDPARAAMMLADAAMAA